MFIFFVLGLILGGVAVVFALQNVDVITVIFFGWQVTGSLSLILLLSMLAGIIIMLFILLPKSIGDHFKYKNLNKEIGKLKEELRKQKELTLFAKKTSPNPGAIAKIAYEAIIHPESKPPFFLRKIRSFLGQ